MPPVTQPGSRTGLITAVVIFVILFVTSTIFAIYYGLELAKNREDLEDLRRQYADVVAPQAVGTPQIRELLDLRQDPEFGRQMSALDIALEQRRQLARVITGETVTAARARAAAQETMVASAEQLREVGVSVPTDNLTAAVTGLTSSVQTHHAEVQNLEQQLADAQEQARLANQRLEEARQAMEQQLAQARETQAADVQAALAGRTDAQRVLQEIERARDEERRLAHDAQSRLQVQLETANREIERLNRELSEARARFAGMRVSVGESIIRQADGQIVRVPGGNIVIINRGFGDQINPGLTFEVFDRHEGVPPLEEDQPLEGKASIEVVRVGATSSEARVIRQRHGTILQEGDLIVNLVYDPHTPYNFVVHGRFDITLEDNPTHHDAEIIKRLIGEWGARVRDQITVDTDFLVIGREPELRPIEDPDDPIERQRFAEAQAELEEFYEIIARARELHIPILNQNQFLHFTGYYTRVRR